MYLNKIYNKIHKRKDQLVDKLYEVPKRDKGVNMPKFARIKPNVINQADLLFLPNDMGFKYLLVVVDNGSRLFDCQPLKSKSTTAVLNGFKKIYSRDILSMPQRIEVDAGSEFKGKVAKYFDDNNVSIRVAVVGRHRQQGIVEYKNQIIGYLLLKRQTEKELKNKKVNKQWVKDIGAVKEEINNHTKKKNKKIKPKSLNYKPLSNSYTQPTCQGSACKILDVGTKVYVALEYPINPATGKKLHGHFRKSDIRFHPKVRTIKEILIKPESPVMYLLDGNETDRKVDLSASYTKNQLLVA